MLKRSVGYETSRLEASGKWGLFPGVLVLVLKISEVAM